MNTNKQNVNSKSGIFLMEIIISIMFFSIAGAVCLFLFVKARGMTGEAAGITFAVSETNGIASVLNRGEDAGEALKALKSYYKDNSSGDRPVELYYNGDFEPCSENEAAYVITVNHQGETEEGVSGFLIDVYKYTANDVDVKEHIYSLKPEVFYE